MEKQAQKKIVNLLSPREANQPGLEQREQLSSKKTAKYALEQKSWKESLDDSDVHSEAKLRTPQPKSVHSIVREKETRLSAMNSFKAGTED